MPIFVRIIYVYICLVKHGLAAVGKDFLKTFLKDQYWNRE